MRPTAIRLWIRILLKGIRNRGWALEQLSRCKARRIPFSASGHCGHCGHCGRLGGRGRRTLHDDQRAIKSRKKGCETQPGKHLPLVKGGGARRSRTALTGFAIRGITALLSRHALGVQVSTPFKTVPAAQAEHRRQKREAWASLFVEFGAGNEARTRDLNLGKVALYQLSYSRVGTGLTRYAPANQTNLPCRPSRYKRCAWRHIYRALYYTTGF